MKQLALNITPTWQPTLDNFVVGRNVEIISTLRHALIGQSTPQPAGQCYLLWGESGSGKSHVLQAVSQYAHTLQLAAHYIDAAEFNHYSTNMLQAVYAPVVAIDDVEKLDDTAQIKLFALYNHLRENGGLLLVSSHAAPAHLTVRDDLRTRLGWGLVYQLHSLSDEEKGQALDQHAQVRGLNLPHEVTQYLLRHGRRDLPALLAVLDELDTHCLRLKRTPSVPLLKEVMQNFNLEMQ